MGIVYLARQSDLERRVAVKVLRRDVSTDAETVARFRREARVAAKLTGPHVARIIDFGTTDDGHPFMVLEYLEGNDLDDEIERRGALPLEEAARYILEACEGMKEAHALGVVHRDLKPSNLFLANEGGRRKVKVLDFGISKVTADEQVRVTQTSSAFGTPLYMSPEHMRSTKAVDHRTDVWSLGVILYELVTGVPPFEGDSATALAVAVATEPFVPPSVQRPGLPRELDAVMVRALAKNPADRFSTIAELADAVRPFATGEIASGPLEPRPRAQAVESGAMTTTHVAQQTASRTRVRFALAAAAGLALVASAAAVFFFTRPGGSTTMASSSVRPEPEPTPPAASPQPVVATSSAVEPVVSAAPPEPSAATSSKKPPSKAGARPSATEPPAVGKPPDKRPGLPVVL